MDVSLPFITNTAQTAKRKKQKIIKKKVKRTLVKFKSDHTPVEIQNMDDQELEYLYEHGSPTEQDVADQILRARKKWDLAFNYSPDDILPEGSGSGGARD